MKSGNTAPDRYYGLMSKLTARKKSAAKRRKNAARGASPGLAAQDLPAAEGRKKLPHSTLRIDKTDDTPKKTSREPTKECSPRRKPWVSGPESASRGGAKETSLFFIRRTSPNPDSARRRNPPRRFTRR